MSLKIKDYGRNRKFRSVDAAGGINETYGDQSPVDFNAIKDDLSGEAL